MLDVSSAPSCMSSCSTCGWSAKRNRSKPRPALAWAMRIECGHVYRRSWRRPGDSVISRRAQYRRPGRRPSPTRRRGRGARSEQYSWGDTRCLGDTVGLPFGTRCPLVSRSASRSGIIEVAAGSNLREDRERGAARARDRLNPGLRRRGSRPIPVVARREARRQPRASRRKAAELEPWSLVAGRWLETAAQQYR